MQENNQEKSPIKRKISLFLEKKGITPYEFYKRTGITRGILSQNNGISEDNLARFLAHFPEVNLEWLLTGRGEMLKTNRTTSDFSDHITPISNDKDTKFIAHKQVNKIHFPKSSEKIYEHETVALYDIEAAANLHSILSNRDENIIGQIIIPNIPKCDGAIYVHGDSMSPLLKSGDIIAFKFVPNELSSIYYGEMYLLSVDLNGDEHLTVKYLKRSEKGDDWVKLVSHNPNHDPKDVPVSAIRFLALVKFSISMHTMS